MNLRCISSLSRSFVIMNSRRNLALTCFFVLLCQLAATARSDKQETWLGTWATAPQAAIPGDVQKFQNQTVRLIVHISAKGSRVRVKISNTFGDQPLLIGAAHIARRTSGADIDPASDRTLTFDGGKSTNIAPRAMVTSDPADLKVSALSDLAISLFLPQPTQATTVHVLAQQTNYISTEIGDATAAAKFPVRDTITSWPFLDGVDVAAASPATAIVAFGSSTTDGDGSSQDGNHRWPDVLAERLQKDPYRKGEFGVLNEGIIGNRLLSDIHSPRQLGGPFEAVLQGLGPALGEAGLTRFDRDVLSQSGVKYVILVLGINDILFPGAFIPETESVSAQTVIEGNRQLIARAHKKGLVVIETTIPPFEDATFRNPIIKFSTPEKEKTRQEVNAWIRSSKEFDGFIDFDEVLRDPSHPTRLLPAYDLGDHLHANDAGYIASGNAIDLALFQLRRPAN
jgi:lysophospholipase L1-like esterase